MFVQLYRPGDGSYSESKDFTYKPENSAHCGRKRPRTDSESSSVYLNMPTVLPNDNYMDLLNEPAQNWTFGAESSNPLYMAETVMENIISDFEMTSVTPEGSIKTISYWLNTY